MKTASGWVRKKTSRSNSRLVRLMRRPRTVTAREAVETTSSPAVMSRGSTLDEAGARRSTERTRSASSRGENGLVR